MFEFKVCRGKIHTRVSRSGGRGAALIIPKIPGQRLKKSQLCVYLCLKHNFVCVCVLSRVHLFGERRAGGE